MPNATFKTAELFSLSNTVKNFWIKVCEASVSMINPTTLCLPSLCHSEKGIASLFSVPPSKSQVNHCHYLQHIQFFASRFSFWALNLQYLQFRGVKYRKHEITKINFLNFLWFSLAMFFAMWKLNSVGELVEMLQHLAQRMCSKRWLLVVAGTK